MTRKPFIKLVVSAVLVAAAGTVLAGEAKYEAIVLHPSEFPQSWGFGAGGGQQVGASSLFGPGGVAFLWNGSPESLVHLHPSGYQWSAALAASGGMQAGAAGGANSMHAILWNGSATDYVNLHTPLYDFTAVRGMGLNVQAGFGRTDVGKFGMIEHALLWHGTSGSAVVLHPGGDYVFSTVNATDGIQQVGSASHPEAGIHASLWAGSAESFVSLRPDGALFSTAWGVAGGQQAGVVTFTGNANAAVWYSSASSFVNLNPGKGWGSSASATNGKQQVGIASGPATFGRTYAAVWSSSAESMHLLHAYLPKEYQGQGAFSTAEGIDVNGDIVGYARHIPTNTNRAVMWRVIPEPGTIAALAAGLGLLLARRRRKRRD